MPRSRNCHAPKCLPVLTAASLGLAFVLVISSPIRVNAQMKPGRFEVDPSWPRPLPNRWVTGAVGGVCVDSQDHVFILNRGGLTENELDSGRQAPAVIEFDAEGDIVNSWGDRGILPEALHGCFIDHENNVWISGSGSGFVQKYTHDGKKLLLQIGTPGVVDSSDGSLAGVPLNASHTHLFRPSAVAVDSGNGEIYIADGEEPGSNHRVIVFDRNGRFLREWNLHSESEKAEDASFAQLPHCVSIGKDGLVYVCDRRGDRVQVFDKMGKFQKNIPVPYEPRSQRLRLGPGHKSRQFGTADWIGFSSDRGQTLMYVLNEDDEQVEILDRGSGNVLSKFGRVGHQVGEFTFAETLAVDSKGNIYVGESGGDEAGNRVQKFRVAGN